MTEKISKKKGIGILGYISMFLVSVFAIYFLFFNFYRPSAENQFIRKIEEAFNKTSTNYVMIKNVTDFEWDTVCFFHEDMGTPVLIGYVSPVVKNSIPETISRYTGVHYDALKGEISSFGRLDFKGAHIFLSNDRIVKRFFYHSNGFRIRNDKLMAYHVININDETYAFLNHSGFENEPCQEKNNATFKSIENINDRKKIVLTNNLDHEGKL